MRKFIILFSAIITIAFSSSAHAILSLELTKGIAGAIPIAIVPFKKTNDLPQNVSGIITSDLQNSGRFKIVGGDAINVFPKTAKEISSDYFRRLGTDNVVVGDIESLSGNQYRVKFQLVDIYQQSPTEGILIDKKYTVSDGELRSLAHHISDLIFQKLTGIRGIFSTKIAYVVVQRPQNAKPRYILEVSDQDGYSPRPLLNSPEPIMSPSWSPNGRQIAYVSFENRMASIYIQDLASGSRQKISSFPGINSAPAWSPDGKKLAIVLSKSGSPNIYILDISSRKVTALTNDFYINTEPAWSPSGKSLLFTSNRSGGVQVYQLKLANKSIERMTFDGDYNARPSYTKDGSHIVMIHRVSGIFKIGIMDLDTGNIRVLDKGAGDSSSPSIAPNGIMILFDTITNGRNVLGLVSSDGGIRLVMPARNGDAQDPAWSPFLS